MDSYTIKQRVEIDKAEQAIDTNISGFNCAQSVFSTYCEQLGLDQETALKISCSFGGGMAHTGETCGAVTGALMLIGLKYGKTKADDNEAREKTYAAVQEFTERFRERYGSLRCSDLLGYYMNDPEELKFVQDHGITRATCPKYIRDSARLIEELLFREKQ